MKGSALISACAVSAVVGLGAQNAPPKPRYDAATIKSCVPEENPTGARGGAGGTNATVSPGRFFVPCVTTEQLIYLAYASFGAREDEKLANDDPGSASNAVKVRGGPAWVHSLSDKYQIEATAQGATERTVLMGAMLQSLLEDRFHLKLHRATEEISLLSLTIGKGGFKLKPMKEGDCDPNAAPGPVAPGGRPKCGNLTMTTSDEGKTRWAFGTGTMSSLAGQMSRNLGVHVVDNTGIADKFVFTFEFERGQDALDMDANLRAALDQQLGLKLEKAKGPRGFPVIDSIDRPAPDLPFNAHTEQPKPRYDAATIKRCQAEENPGPARGTAGGTNATFSPGRFFVPCVTAEQLIYLAYAASGAREDEHLINDGLGGPSDDKKIRGGPDWVHSLREKYQIEATASGATERTVLMGTMLRTLLEERFQLKTHRESEDVPMFALTVAKSGFKLKPMQPGDCDVDAAPLTDMSVPAKPPCNSQMTRGNGPNLVWIFGGGDIDALAGRLSRPVGLHVIDQTGLKGEFIIRFEFHPDENTPGLPWTAADNADASAPMADNIFTALEKQLGLKLEKVKAPRGFLVIDHIERPTPDIPAAAAAGARARGAR